jgi:hypothetical protein
MRLEKEKTQALLELAQWTTTHRKKRHTIRQLVETEEDYQLFIRELDRIESQGFRARAQHAEVSLTLAEWLATLNYFYWRCAYCQERPFQILSYHLPLLQGGMTALNCLPSCYHCRHSQREMNEHIQRYFEQTQVSTQYVTT